MDRLTEHQFRVLMAMHPVDRTIAVLALSTDQQAVYYRVAVDDELARWQAGYVPEICQGNNLGMLLRSSGGASEGVE